MSSKPLHRPRPSPGFSFYPRLILGGFGWNGRGLKRKWHFRFFHDNSSHLWKTLAWQMTLSEILLFRTFFPPSLHIMARRDGDAKMCSNLFTMQLLARKVLDFFATDFPAWTWLCLSLVPVPIIFSLCQPLALTHPNWPVGNGQHATTPLHLLFHLSLNFILIFHIKEC